MRRQEAVRHGERRCHRNADLEQANLRRCRDCKDERDEEDEADFIEERNADNEARKADRPLDLFLSKHIDERHGNALCTTALRHQLAENRAERNDDGKPSERPAKPLLDDGDDLRDGQSFGIADETCDDEQRDETVQLHANDEEEQQQDAHS